MEEEYFTIHFQDIDEKFLSLAWIFLERMTYIRSRKIFHELIDNNKKEIDSASQSLIFDLREIKFYFTLIVSAWFTKEFSFLKTNLLK